VRVEIEYDGETPHFGGKAWIRKGSTTQEATEEAFQRLIDYRSNKVRELAKRQGETVSIEPDTSQTMDRREGAVYQVIPRLQQAKEARLINVNGFWATFRIAGGADLSEPLDKLIPSWDDVRQRLKVLLKQTKDPYTGRIRDVASLFAFCYPSSRHAPASPLGCA
jgi:hypothetical protein